MPRTHTHWEGGPVCKYPTKKECDAAYRAWQEEEWEKLAQRVAARTNPRDPDYWKGDDTKFGQRVQAIRAANAVEGGTLNAS